MRLTSLCLVMWIKRTVATGLQTTHTNFTNVRCLVQMCPCGEQLLLMALLVLTALRMRRGVQSLCMQSGTKVTLATFLHIELHPCEQDLLWFQQNGATAHTAEISMPVLRTVFPGRLISRFAHIMWPSALSPDLAVPDYFLWGYVKSRIYETRPANTAIAELWSVFKGSPRKCDSVLWQPFHRDCRSVLNDMVVTYKVSYSNNNDWDEFSRTWNAPDIVNKTVPFGLKKLLHLKNRQFFLRILYNRELCTYINVCKHMHSHWNPFHLLCPWSGYGPDYKWWIASEQKSANMVCFNFGHQSRADAGQYPRRKKTSNAMQWNSKDLIATFAFQAEYRT